MKNEILKIIKKYNDYFSIIFSLKDTLEELKESDVIVFCHDNDRAIDLNGKAYSPILDSYVEELIKSGLSVQSLAHPWSKIVGKKAFNDPIVFNRSYFIAMVLDKVTKKQYTKKLYKNIILKSNSKRIVTIGCNDELCKAAHELGVLHVEILHGIGYTPMPWGWDKKTKESLPQEIYTLDLVSTETFKELEKHDIKVTQIQHPFLKKFTPENLINLPNEWVVSPGKENRKSILVSLQWGYAPNLDCYPEFAGVLEENGLFPEELLTVIKNTSKDIFWRFRFHPIHYRNQKKYKKHFDFIQNIIDKYQCGEWKESTFKPLPSVLSQCTGHITMSSMSSYEAAYMGVPTLALCPTLKKGRIYESFFNDLAEDGYLVKGNADVVEISQWIVAVKRINPIL